MVIISTICIAGIMYALGRTHGYERCEKHNSFWKDVEKNGL